MVWDSLRTFRNIFLDQLEYFLGIFTNKYSDDNEKNKILGDSEVDHTI